MYTQQSWDLQYISLYIFHSLSFNLLCFTDINVYTNERFVEAPHPVSLCVCVCLQCFNIKNYFLILLLFSFEKKIN